MTDCYYDKKDWRACAKEVSRTPNDLTAVECRSRESRLRHLSRLWANGAFRWKNSSSAGRGRATTSEFQPRTPEEMSQLYVQQPVTTSTSPHERYSYKTNPFEYILIDDVKKSKGLLTPVWRWRQRPGT